MSNRVRSGEKIKLPTYEELTGATEAPVDVQAEPAPSTPATKHTVGKKSPSSAKTSPGAQQLLNGSALLSPPIDASILMQRKVASGIRCSVYIRRDYAKAINQYGEMLNVAPGKAIDCLLSFLEQYNEDFRALVELCRSDDNG